jgi:hypothetical protein
MQSHTVPRKLLEQFAYYDHATTAKRLWRYEKGRAPYWKASPKTATRIDGHFVDPESAEKEAEIEIRLNREFEEPVNSFLFRLTEPGFVLTDVRRRQLTFYVTLLFLRSEARRRASLHLQKVVKHTYDLFMANDLQVRTVAVKWSIDLLHMGVRRCLVTRGQVLARARAAAADVVKEIRAQQSYVSTLETFMSNIDDKIFAGKWNCVRTDTNDPFIISDAPVVTWERLSNGRISYGLGFHRPNVEVFLPISSLACLHILPAVERSAAVVSPSASEVNAAQAAFAGRYCFANKESSAIDRVVQENFGKAELGVRGFTLWHRDYSTAIYDILMGQPPGRLPT